MSNDRTGDGVPASINRAASPVADGAALTPQRGRFERLLDELERRRAQLHAWGEALARWHARYGEQVVPLLLRRDALDAQLVERLDQAWLQERLGAGDREVVSELIRGLAGPLVEGGRDDLRPLLQRHAEAVRALPADVPATPEWDQARLQLAQAYGLEPEQVDALEDAEQLLAQWRQRHRQRQAHTQRRRAGPKRPVPAAPPPLRELYRRLAAQLHPDRARDAADGERRTVLMQRLNAAYQREDLIGLIELQAEIGLADARDVARLGEQRLQQYNDELERQCRSLDRELQQLLERFRAQYGLAATVRLEAARLDRLMAAFKRQLEAELETLRQDLQQLLDPRQLRRWLKQQRQWQAADADDEDA